MKWHWSSLSILFVQLLLICHILNDSRQIQGYLFSERKRSMVLHVGTQPERVKLLGLGVSSLWPKEWQECSKQRLSSMTQPRQQRICPIPGALWYHRINFISNAIDARVCLNLLPLYLYFCKFKIKYQYTIHYSKRWMTTKAVSLDLLSWLKNK